MPDMSGVEFSATRMHLVPGALQKYPNLKLSSSTQPTIEEKRILLSHSHDFVIPRQSFSNRHHVQEIRF